MLSGSANFDSSKDQKYLSIWLDKCMGTSCKNDTEIQRAVSSSEIELITIESYHDNDDNDIKQYLNPKYRFPISNFFMNIGKLQVTPNIIKKPGWGTGDVSFK